MTRRTAAKELRAALVLGAALAVAAGAAPAAAKKGSDDSAKARSSLAATGAVSGAEGECRVQFGGGRSRFEVRVDGLLADAEHVLTADGLAWATFATDRKGGAKLRFSSSPKGSKQRALPGDPRGRALAVSQGGTDVLAGVCSGEGESDDSTSKLRARLAAKASFEIRKDGRQKFEVELERVPAGDYAVFVDGVERGVVTVGPLGLGETEWGDDDGGPALDFDPRGKAIDVASGADVLFTGTLAGSIPGVTTCAFSETETALVAAAAAGAGSGDTKLRVREDCRRDFSVEIEDVPLGSYDLFVGGALRGQIQVVDVAGRNEGELEFTSEPGELDEVFLDFEPVGATVEVKQGDVLFFSLTQGGPGTGGGGGSCTEGPLEVELPLLNPGAVPAASGKARYRIRDDCDRDFRVEIEDVADGGYDLRVGGVSRGTIAVVAGEGELEFADPVEPGKLLLDFDPRGQAVEVFDGGTLVLQRAFPE
jgi:hypothetical protein